jgi:phosphoglycerol transferase MdoB-like AlkP superfamily enzyme
MLPNSLSLNIKRILLLTGIYSLLRVLFLIFNMELFSNFSTKQLLTPFIIGIRYDLTALALLNIPFWVVGLLPIFWKNIYWKKTEGFLFIFINTLFIFFNLGDIEYSNFVGRRLTWDTFKMQKDLQNSAFAIIKYYWVLFLVSILFIISVSIILKSIKLKYNLNKKIIAYLFFPYLILFIIFSRGGVQLKPIRAIHAGIWVPHELIPLSTNSTFTLLKSIKDNQLKEFNFFTKKQALENVFIGSEVKIRWLAPKQKIKNVIFIILESFASEYIGKANNNKGYTPFLDDLIEDAVFFKNGFANGRRSIESLPSILCSLPSLMKDAFITSQFQTNNLNCLPEVLNRIGYATLFFHGAENGSMFFDSFSKKSGIQEYFGLNEFPKGNINNNTWGIHDEPFLKFASETLDIKPEPFFATLFTLSSHHPYTIPIEYKNSFPKGSLEIHESIGYSDYALKKFFETSRNKKWFNNTLFILTADHTQKSNDPKYKNILGNYRVPIIFYYPPGWQNFESDHTEQVMQHIDIFPTVIDLLDLQSDNLFLGRSVNSNIAPRAFNFNGESYWFWEGKNLLSYSGKSDDDIEILNIKDEMLDQHFTPSFSNQNQSLIKFQSILQLYSSGMQENKLVIKKSELKN